MARIRYIRPTIIYNDELAALGPYAYILFTSLWMIADREGRIRYRPRKIKAEAMPLWDDVTVEVLIGLLDSLWKSGFIDIYDVGGGEKYISIKNWHLHQKPHHNEKPSKLPPSPELSTHLSTQRRRALRRARDARYQAVRRAKRASANIATQKSTTFSGTENDLIRCQSAWGMGNLKSSTCIVSTAVEDRGSGGKKPPPPPSAIRTETQKVKPPADPPASVQRKPPTADPWWPYSLDDVGLVRWSLSELGAVLHMKLQPDDDIVRRVLDSARGAPAQRVHETLLRLWKNRVFDKMYSWGLVPRIVAQAFAAPVQRTG